MFDLFAHGFMQRALLAGLIVAVLCPAIGLFLVLRRLAQFGDTLAHVSLAGVAAGLLMKTSTVATGLAFSVGASLAMDWLRQSYRRYSELSVAIMLSASLATAGVLLSMTSGSGASVMALFFGSILTVSGGELAIVSGLGAAVLVILLLLSKELISVSFDEEAARLSGLPVRIVNMIFMGLTAVTVAIAMNVVGVLLVSSLMVVPVATALQVAHSFRTALLWSIASGVVAVASGLVLAGELNLAPGGTIVLSAVAILFVVVGYKRLRGLE